MVFSRSSAYLADMPPTTRRVPRVDGHPSPGDKVPFLLRSDITVVSFDRSQQTSGRRDGTASN